MGWHNEQVMLDDKPRFGDSHLFGNEILTISSGSSIPDRVFINENAAHRALFKSVSKNSAGYAVIIDKDSFTLTKPLERKLISLLREGIKTYKFELGKLENAYSKASKNCPVCRTHYSIENDDLIFDDTNSRIKFLKQEIAHLESSIENKDSLKAMAVSDIYFEFGGISCSLCRHRHVMMTMPSSKRATEATDKFLEKHREFIDIRDKEANKQGLRGSSKVSYMAMGMLHELS